MSAWKCLALGAAISVTSACGGGDDARTGTVNVYSTRHYDSDRVMYDAFEAESGIRVRTREQKGSLLQSTLRQEGDATPADAVIAADVGTLWVLKDEGLLQPFDLERMPEAIPSNLIDPDGSWVGLSRRMRVIFVDPERVPDGAITSYRDLADPQWEGEICVRSSTNIYNLSLLGDLIDRWGEAEAASWTRAVVSNFARDPQGGDTDQIRAVAAGECGIAIANHYYYLRLLNSNDPAERADAEAVGVILPEADGGVHQNITGIARVGASERADETGALLNYLATAEGQAMLVRETGELPILADVSALPGAEVFETAAVREVDLNVFGENQATARRLFDDAGWD